MTRLAGDGVERLFAAITRDLTPSSAKQSAQVLYARFTNDPAITEQCRSILSVAEQQQAARIAAPSERALFQQRRAFRRFCGARALRSEEPLTKICYELTSKGRPYLPAAPGIWFSFSSSRAGMLGAWSTSLSLGVDIEDACSSLEFAALTTLYFSVPEVESIMSGDLLQRPQRFLQHWTLKEAALKSIGEGLPFGLDAFEFALEPHSQLVRAFCDATDQFVPYCIHGTDGVAALVTRRLS